MNSSRIRMALIVAVVVALAALASRARASYTPSETPLFTNESSVLVASDAADGDSSTNRHLVMMQWPIQFRAVENSGYRVQYQLLDAAGQAVPLVSGRNVSGNVYNTPIVTVTLAAGAKPVIHGFEAAVQPVTPTAFSTPYRISATFQVWIPATGIFGGRWNTLGTVVSRGRTFYHLPATPSPDDAYHLTGSVSSPQLASPVIFKQSDGTPGFRVTASMRLLRYDDYTEAAPTQDEVPFTYQLVMRDVTTGTDVVLKNAVSRETLTIPSYVLSGAVKTPYDTTRSLAFEFLPENWNTFDPTHPYDLSIRISYQDPELGETLFTGAPRTVADGPQRLLALTGVLRFGDTITGRFSALANDPRASLNANGDGTSRGTLVIASGNGSAGDSSWRFGDGVTPLQVIILANGDAVCASGSLAFQGETPVDQSNLSGLSVSRSGGRLGAGGLTMTIGLRLPAGFGYTHTLRSRRLFAAASWSGVPCGENLLPLSEALTKSPSELGSPTSRSFAVKDGLPLRMEFGKLVWFVHQGEIQLEAGSAAIFVRDEEDRALDDRVWSSNDGYFRFVHTWQYAALTADESGAARLSAAFSFDPGWFLAHFPDLTSVAWGDAGDLVFENDEILVSKSGLHSAKPGQFTYQRGFPQDGVCAQVEERVLDFDPAEPSYAFTPDGGLRLTVKLPETEPLSWGLNGSNGGVPTYAHQTAGFPSGRLLISGQRLRGAGFAEGEDPSQKAVWLHYTGTSSPAQENRSEPPDFSANSPYRQGEADYAGLNFRVQLDLAAGSRTATSHLGGGHVGPYPLHEAAKYYARRGGVSGRHQSAGTPAGQPSPLSSLLLFGFQCNLDAMKLGYLDSDNVFSLSNGTIEVPAPSHFDQPIERLRFDGAGRPRDAELAQDVTNRLEHWATDFTALTFRFQPKLSDGCPSFDSGALALGAEVDASALTSQPLYGELGFLPSGHLVPKGSAGNYAGLSSELMVPSQLKVRGGQADFILAPHGKAYFSAAGGSPQPAEGWINLYGALDVPFFQDVKVQIHLLNASNAGGGILHLMGGWPASDSGVNQYGWHENQRTPFNDPLFDSNQRGYPQGVSLNGYRSPAANERNYRPRAEQDWLDVVTFGYSLQWDGATRRFITVIDEEKEILVLTMQHRLLSLTSTTAEITFGAKVDAFPALNVSKLLSAQLDGAFEGLIESLTQQGLQVTGLNDAVRSFDSLLSTQWLDLLEEPLTAALNADDFPIDIARWAVGDSPTPGSELAAQAYASAIQNLAGGSGELTGQLRGQLQDIIDALTMVRDLIPANGSTNMLGPLVRAVLNQADLPPAISAHLAQVISAATSEAELNRSLPAFQELRATTERLIASLQTVQTQLNAANSLRGEIHGALANARGEYEPLIESRIRSYFAPFQGRVDLAIAERGEANIRRELNRIVLQAMISSSAAGPVQAAIKLHLGETQATFRGTLDSLFGEVNRCIRTAVSTVDGIDLPGLNAVSKGAGAMADVFQGASLDGYAQIIGDSLQRLRVDGKLSLKAADAMEFYGWFQIDALNANNPRSACYCGDVSQARGAEVIIGGQAPISLFGSDASIRVEGLFAFGACAESDGIGLMGLAGSMGLEGELKMAGITINEIGFGFSFGQASNYIHGKARANFKGYEFAAAIFAGSSCGLGPLLDTDADIAQLFSEPGVGVDAAAADTTRITGFYTYAEGWIPLNEFIGIPDSCMLSLRAGMGFGPFAFVVQKPGEAERLALGAKYLLGIEARVLCVAKLGARAKLMGAISVDWPITPLTFDALLERDLKLRLLGTATFSASIGPCPFCVDFEKDVKFHATVSKSDTGFGFGH